MSYEEQSHLREIFEAAVKRVDPYRMVRESLTLEGNTLHIITPDVAEEIDLSTFSRVVVIGAGKAAAPMARALEELLGDRIAEGVVSVKRGHGVPLKRIVLLEAGHPVPDATSLRAGRRALELAREADGNTLFLNVISGGGSALLEALVSVEADGERTDVTLEELQSLTEQLLASGASIHEVNCIRKHLSQIKGGRLAEATAPAHSVNLILSDVVGDNLHSIASGLTVADPTSFATSRTILERYGLDKSAPDSIRRVIEIGCRGDVPETPKPDNPIFAKTRNILLGSNYLALRAAEARAVELGYEPIILTSQLTGEAREAALFIASIMKEVRLHHLPLAPPVCLLFGGETTVTLRGTGRGGRNTELALALLREMSATPGLFAGGSFLSAGTDGTDGPTDAAGAFATSELARFAEDRNLNASAFLERNDSYTFFDAINGLLKTGPTKTNVCDVQIALIRE
ncbi:MAG: glycerate kinase [Spirochaetales bacterium]